ncbi:MAG: hypothetical protein Roseis2KO_19890 [Roseivirga sp.]
MKILKHLSIVLLMFLSAQSFAQHAYPEVTNNCYLDQFTLESDSIIAKIDNAKIIEAVTQGWDDKMKSKIEGVLGLQILVDNRGNSCLISYRNDTNQKTKKMNIEANVNDNLKWSRQSIKVSAIAVLEFKDGEITVKRMGTKDYVNLIELKDN